MSNPPDSCNICGTAIPEGASRCPGCGAVWGDANRCPHCHATAGIKQGLRGGYVCMACGKDREPKPGTTIFESASPFPLVGRTPVQTQSQSTAPHAPADEAPARAVAPAPPAPSPMAPRGKAAGLRVLGVLSIAGGVLVGTVAAFLLPGVGGIIAAAALGAVGVGIGGFSLRAASRSAEEADRRTDTQRELALLRLAEQHDGVLTVTAAARGLGISIAEADEALTAMADGSRIWAEVTTDGFVQYTFREMQARQGPRVRVEEDADAPATSEEEQALADLEEELRERKL